MVAGAPWANDVDLKLLRDMRIYSDKYISTNEARDPYNYTAEVKVLADMYDDTWTRIGLAWNIKVG